MSGPELKAADILAVRRTRMASERTLMAWIRTAISMISFGFTIYKFLQYMVEQGALVRIQPQGPRNLGMTLITLGTLALLFAAIQHWRYVGGLLAEAGERRRWDLALTMAALIVLMGLHVLVNVIFLVRPF